MAELHVSKKNIKKLFGEMQGNKFIIPDYQRPYKWDVEKCETLWNDIVDFMNTDAQLDSDYFLGTIVSYVTPGKDLELIDGQQRVTSFLLLLRAFYRKLEDMTPDKYVYGLMSQLAPCLWDVEAISQEVSDPSKIRINSLVATEDDNDKFHKILREGIADNGATDNYSVNYRFFKKRCDEYAEQNPLKWQDLCVTILQKCIVLPIECDTHDTALTIFSTLNDRGLLLADSDIFKARIYKDREVGAERTAFTALWKELTQLCKAGGFRIDDMFRFYTHVLRSRADDKTKEVGLRRYYADADYRRLKTPELMTEIYALAEFWLWVNRPQMQPEDVEYELSVEARKYLHCLECYPNEFWRYAVSVFFVKNKDSKTFDADFVRLLKTLISFLFSRFIEFPTVNAIKDDIYSACINIEKTNRLGCDYQINAEALNAMIPGHASSRLSRALLLLDAYLNIGQKELIPATFDIEHIFPKKWQSANYFGWDYDKALLSLDRFGNKVVIEKKINIQAGNGYFGNKRLRYAHSAIANVLDLSQYPNADWLEEDIAGREENFKTRLIRFFTDNQN